MRFYRNLLIVVVIVAAVIAFLKLGTPYFVSPQRPSSPAPTPSATPAPPMQPVAMSTPRPQPPPMPKPAMTPVPTNYRSRLEAVARSQRVSIVGYSESGLTVNVVVDWVGDSVGPGGDFLDEGVKQGIIRNFNDKGFREYYDRQGRRHFQAAYELYVR